MSGSGINCGHCHQWFSHDSGLREHLRTSFCNANAPQGQEKSDPLKGSWYLGVDLVPLAAPPPMTATQKHMTDIIREEVYEPPSLFSQPSVHSLKEEINGLTNRVRSLLNMLDEQRAWSVTARAQIAALEKLAARAPSFDPKLHRALAEKTDYTRVFSSDEDGLEEEYRGWPAAKEKVIF